MWGQADNLYGGERTGEERWPERYKITPLLCGVREKEHTWTQRRSQRQSRLRQNRAKCFACKWAELKENWSKAICWAVVVERFLAGLGNESIRLIYMKSWKWLSVRWCYQGYDRERVQALTSPLTNLLHQEVLLEFGCPGPCSHFSNSGSLWVSPQDLPVFFIALFLLSYILIIYSCLIIVQLT